MNYGEILSKAWKIIWKNKILWLFGILAGCSASSGVGRSGGSSAGSSGTNAAINPDSLDFLGSSTQKALTDFGQLIAGIDVWVWILLAIGLFVVVFILSIAFYMLGTLGETGVIAGTSLADKADQDAPRLSLGAVFTALKPHYWKVLLFRIGYGLINFFIVLFLLIPIILLMTCTCCLGFLLLIPVGWFLEIMVRFTIIAIIDEGLGIFPAISRAWAVFTRNLLPAVVMVLILGLGGLIVAVAISLPLLLILLPFGIILTIMLTTGSGTLMAGLIFSILLSLVLVPVLILLSGVFQTYVLAAWTLTYRRLSLNEDLKPTLLSDTPVED